MDTNASLGRFYAFTANPPPTLPSSASSPDPQSRRYSSGSDSVSDEDGGSPRRSHPSGRANPDYDGLRVPYGSQNSPPHQQNRADSAPATIYVDDPPYIPPTFNRPSQTSTFVEPAPDVPFNPSAHAYHPGFSSSMAPTTLHSTPLRRTSGQSSPTGSNGSGGSDRSNGQSRSSQGSVSSGVVSIGSPPRDPLQQGHDVFPPRQRAPPFPNFNPEHYPAYDEHFRRVGMEHARFGTDPRQTDNAYYRPRTHTYPPVGAPQMPMGMASPEPLPMSTFPPSPEMQLLPMHVDDASFDRGYRQDHLIPGQTRIQLPSAAPPQSYDGYGYGSPSTSHLRVGDDAYIQTDDSDVRRILGLSPDQELSLFALADPPPGQRPGQSIPTLSQLAILGSPQKRLTLQEIYLALEERFEWFRLNRDDKSWQNSIRHNLSLYKCFKRIPKPITEPGKGSYWTVDYTSGAGTKRPRKRNPRPTKAEREQRARDATEAQGGQEVLEDGDSSGGSEEEVEDFPSPARSNLDFPIDPALQQGHQVGQGRVTRSSARNAVRRGNSPYAQNAPGPTRRQTAPGPLTNLTQAGTRHPSATFGQPSFGQPSLGPAVMGSSLFGQTSMGAGSASGNWQPGMSQQGTGSSQNYLPPPRPRPIVGAASAPSDAAHANHMRGAPTRSHTMPALTLTANPAAYNSLPSLPLPGIDQLRDNAGRFVARGTYAAAQIQASSQQFVQGPSRPGGGRRTSSSGSGSSGSRE